MRWDPVRDWQFDVIFVIGAFGSLIMLFSDPLGIVVRPEVVTLFGVMLAFVYSRIQKRQDKRDDDDDR
jgi:hypothetical protein